MKRNITDKDGKDFFRTLYTLEKYYLSRPDASLQERVEMLNQFVGSFLDRHARLSPHLKEQLKRNRH